MNTRKSNNISQLNNPQTSIAPIADGTSNSFQSIPIMPTQYVTPVTAGTYAMNPYAQMLDPTTFNMMTHYVMAPTIPLQYAPIPLIPTINAMNAFMPQMVDPSLPNIMHPQNVDLPVDVSYTYPMNSFVQPGTSSSNELQLPELSNQTINSLTPDSSALLARAFSYGPESSAKPSQTSEKTVRRLEHTWSANELEKRYYDDLKRQSALFNEYWNKKHLSQHALQTKSNSRSNLHNDKDMPTAKNARSESSIKKPQSQSDNKQLKWHFTNKKNTGRTKIPFTSKFQLKNQAEKPANQTNISANLQSKAVCSNEIIDLTNENSGIVCADQTVLLNAITTNNTTTSNADDDLNWIFEENKDDLLTAFREFEGAQNQSGNFPDQVAWEQENAFLQSNPFQFFSPGEKRPANESVFAETEQSLNKRQRK